MARKHVYANQAKKVRYIRAQKEGKPCTDCDEYHPHYVMDFDHVSGSKLFNLSGAAYSHGMQSIIDEIAKCELVCSNCHRERTFQRLGGS